MFGVPKRLHETRHTARRRLRASRIRASDGGAPYQASRRDRASCRPFAAADGVRLYVLGPASCPLDADAAVIVRLVRVVPNLCRFLSHLRRFLFADDHCPFCVRVRLALGIKNIKHNVRPPNATAKQVEHERVHVMRASGVQYLASLPFEPFNQQLSDLSLCDTRRRTARREAL